MSGVTLMVLSSACFAAMSAFVKAIGRALPFFEVVLFRGLVGLPLVLVLTRRAGHSLASERKPLLLLRGLLGWAGMSAYYFGLQRGKLAELAMLVRGQPLFIALFAPVLIRERAPRSTLGVLLVGLAGIALVLKPTPAAFTAASGAGLLTAVLSALAHIAVRRLSATEPPLRIVAYMTLVFVACSALGSLGTPVWPSGPQLLLLLGAGISGTCGQLLMTTAYGRDRAAVISTAGQINVVFALLLGVTFWSELPDALSLVGGALVVGGGIFLAYSRRGIQQAP